MDKDKQEKLKEFCRKLAPVAGAALGEMVRQERGSHHQRPTRNPLPRAV